MILKAVPVYGRDGLRVFGVRGSILFQIAIKMRLMAQPDHRAPHPAFGHLLPRGEGLHPSPTGRGGGVRGESVILKAKWNQEFDQGRPLYSILVTGE
jgi:hypothetical protein